MITVDIARHPPPVGHTAYSAFVECRDYVDAMARVDKPVASVRLYRPQFDALRRYAAGIGGGRDVSMVYAGAEILRTEKAKKYSKRRIKVAPDLAAFVR